MEQPKSFLRLLKIDTDVHRVIAVVGGGGKTSLIFRLTEELVSLGKKVIVTTTTHMAYEKNRPFAKDGCPDMLTSQLAVYGYVVAAAYEEEKQKLCSLTEEKLKVLPAFCDVLLVEADGAHRRPLKVPEDWEPVIPSCAKLVIGVAGLDCLGTSIQETAHRPEQTACFLKKSKDDLVTEEDVVKIAASARGLCKNVGEREYRVYLNKTDVLPSTEPAERIVRALEQKNIVAAFGRLL